MEARNEQYRARVRAIVEDTGFTQMLGLELESVQPGRCVTCLPVTDRLLQHDRYVHAGVQATLADHTAGSAAYSLIGADQQALTVEFKINLLRPAVGESLRCESTVLRAGRSIIVAESTLYAGKTADDARMSAKAMVTLAVTNLGA